MIILAIETSCDETAVAIVDFKDNHHQILANIVSSQVKIHAKYGGVVPNLASREHLKNIIPCIRKAIYEARVSREKIDFVAVTIGPGLIPALLIGTNTAKALSYAWNKPIVGVNHIEAHIYANWIDRETTQNITQNHAKSFASVSRGTHEVGVSRQFSDIFPALCLVVSGGHTQLILMKGHGKYKLLGETRDDAIGEAFDKVAKLLGLGYPGGPSIEKKAKSGNPRAFDLPRPMINTKNYDFSFSGLKTAVLYLVKGGVATFTSRSVNDICASFQQAVIDVLIAKTTRAAKEYKVKTVLLAGGVAANEELRRQFKKAIKKELPNTYYLTPNTSLCTDNAVMVAVCAYYYALRGETGSWQDIKADANLRIVV